MADGNTGSSQETSASSGGAPAAGPSDKDACRKKIEERRERATNACAENSFNATGADVLNAKRIAFVKRPFRTGIAFSGGGIRSATISLGLTEALAAKGRFYPFDFMSTVSGGGYFGSFLRSLFVARIEKRGKEENEAIVRGDKRIAFADAVITSLPNDQYFQEGTLKGHFLKTAKTGDQKQTIKNPLWWLRENGRYLAPNGMTDYLFALAFFVRNWLTLMLAILAAMIAAFAAIQLILYGVFWLNPRMPAFVATAEAAALLSRQGGGAIPWSPLLGIIPLLLMIAAGIALGYWFTLGMRHHLSQDTTDDQSPKPEDSRPWRDTIRNGYRWLIGAAKLDASQHKRDSFRIGLCWLISAAIIAYLIMRDLRSDELALTIELSVSVMLLSALVSSSWSALWKREAIIDASGKAKPHLPRGWRASTGWLLIFIPVLLMVKDLVGYEFTGLFGTIIAAAMPLIPAILLVAAIFLYSALHVQGAAQTSLANHMRRVQTRQLSIWLQFVAVVFVIGLIDSIGLFARELSNATDQLNFAKTAISSSAVLSLIATLVAKLPDWLGESKLSIVSMARRYVDTAAFIAAALMLAALAVLADVLVLKTFWKDTAWSCLAFIDWTAFGLLCGVALILILIFGVSTQFLNQSALAPIYTSRLARAYLGGSNLYRLASHTPSDVTRSMIGDDLPLAHYMKADVAAPLHLINVTLNRTVGSAHAGALAAQHAKDDPLIPPHTPSGQDGAGPMPHGRVPSYESQLTLRDRKGDRMVIGPFGIRAGAEFFDWDKMGDNDLMLSQLCAISGAAVSSGMGRNTSLGTAMALTMANVRLGYWWEAPKKDEAKKWSWSSLWHSYEYLLDEMLARYDREKPYWYLSDGGHSENSGALSLLERGCELILVADNGQDPDYSFSDLETFIRAARTDIGKEVRPATSRELKNIIPATARHCFLNAMDEPWAKQLMNPDNSSFALLLRATDMEPIENGKPVKSKTPVCWILWLKPCLFKGLTSDIIGYGLNNPQFPQQSTSNQFFDEAQWESYRRLGFAMGSALFADQSMLAEKLPPIYQKRSG